MKPVFQFREGCHISGNAQVVGEHLERIRATVSTLTPEVVLSDARKAKSPLHQFFEWDDSKAAEQHRLQQAGHLIRSVTVTYEDATPQPVRQLSISAVPAAPVPVPRPVRAFVAITQGDGVRGYESTERAMADAGMRRQVLERAHSEMMAVGRKYRELQELSDVFNALDQVGRIIHPTERQAA